MISLVSGFYSYLTRKEEYYIIIIGLDNAGKTTLLERIKTIYLGVKGLSPDKIGPTVGLNIGRIQIGNAFLKFWDLGGQKDLHSIWESYYSECHGVLFVVDSTDKVRLEDCQAAFEKALSNQVLEGVPVLMAANKQDLEGSLKVEEIKEIFNPIAEKLGAQDSRVLPISAIDGQGVKEAIDWLFSRVVFNKENRPPKEQ
ncbi:P-loop containing nucleoside triphosphate hydrolase protein [Conidiobolus coronatus NRRL 28638]|uniref:p-loop containing nucleoside triphosphate hydrolase protein n=1 Tax=Conidiobolus coronatus (strain ATCC 28846 / CBS 209.66 / NRRL 28638) TaxID=796925 RepID=A0A137PG93_CONC2|nr:P-loop containing nucleoside triphosphate hydrolase protein [Conidiobolus coronatus NRRL 28638]|eukprot:KXN74023.1 P-loop containing nucleoside triphosphate hydrolase protein [Conidiobolus coronatus NRRL 28638]